MIGVIDIGSGNIPSVCSALKKNSEKFKLCRNAKDLKNIKRIILPGVGSFKSFIENICNKDLVHSIKKAILNGMPFLGICLGFQALFEKSYEFGDYNGLGILKGEVVHLNNLKKNVMTPHVGWNNCQYQKKSKIFFKIKDNANFYFTHTFTPVKVEKKHIIAYTDCGTNIISVVQKFNAYGVQFHPEKSQLSGLKLIDNFCKIKF